MGWRLTWRQAAAMLAAPVSRCRHDGEEVPSWPRLGDRSSDRNEHHQPADRTQFPHPRIPDPPGSAQGCLHLLIAGPLPPPSRVHR